MFYNKTITSAIGTEHPMNLTHNYSRKGAFRDIAAIVRHGNNSTPKIIAFSDIIYIIYV